MKSCLAALLFHTTDEILHRNRRTQQRKANSKDVCEREREGARDLECGVLVVKFFVQGLHFQCTGLGLARKLGLQNLNEENDDRGELDFKFSTRCPTGTHPDSTFLSRLIALFVPHSTILAPFDCFC